MAPYSFTQTETFMHSFIHLRTYSDYSMGLGSIRTKELVKHCVKNDFPAVALTDKNNLFASLEFSMEAVKNGVQPIVGVDIDINYGEKQFFNMLILAQNDEGYQNLLKISTACFLNRQAHEKPNLSEGFLLNHSAGLIAITAGIGSLEADYFKNNQLDELKSHIKNLEKHFQNRLYLELSRHSQMTEFEHRYEEFIIKTAIEQHLPLVATNQVCFLTRDMHEACDALICISNGRYLIEDDRPKTLSHMYFKSEQEMSDLFKDIPEALENTIQIAKKCHVFPKSRDPLLPNFGKDGSLGEKEMLAQMSRDGLVVRTEHITDEGMRKTYFDRLEYELSVINSMNYSGYFLIVSDFIKWSKNQDIPVGPGRGSGAGSVVAWCLDITDLDPIKFGLLFERFLNPDRISMPDFDIDFCQDRRGEVIEYVAKKYGANQVSQIITFGKLQARAVLRDVGRVLQIAYPVIDRICKMVPNNPANPVTLAEAIKLDKELRATQANDPAVDKLISISLKLEGLTRHASTHAAGIVIADRPIVELAPLYSDQNSTMPVVQYSMKYAELAGLVKFDFLGLKTLTVISWACKLINLHAKKIDINKIALDDPKTYKLLSTGHTVGIFQFESAGMKEAIKKLKPDSIEDLIALGSLYRPGPMDNIPSYINRKHGIEQPAYLHPLMEETLRETYGIIVYQEQVMEIAKVLAGYTLGAADLLRRAMGKKIKSEMDAQKEIFINGCIKNQIDKKMANEIFALIEKFASYGFNKSHAAAYAIISYQTAFLKAHYPVEFLVASMNLEINDTDKINIFCQEAKRIGIEIIPPDVNFSHSNFTIKDNKICYALGALKNVGSKAVDLLKQTREQDGKFTSFYDFCSRVGTRALNKRLIESLANSGALDSFDINRRQVFENSELLMRQISQIELHNSINQIGLFADDSDYSNNNLVMKEFPIWTLQQKLASEYGACGFYLTTHPVESYAKKLNKLGVVHAVDLESRVGKKSVKLTVAGVIASKKIRSSKRGKYAFLQLSDMTGVMDISVFNEELLYQKNDLLKEGTLVILKVDAKIDENGLRIITDNILSIDEATSNIESVLELKIKDLDCMEIIKNCLSNKGLRFRVILELGSGEQIVLASKAKQQYYIDEEKIDQLSESGKIDVNETCI